MIIECLGNVTNSNLDELLFDREDIESYFRCIENIKNNNTEIKERFMVELEVRF